MNHQPWCKDNAIVWTRKVCRHFVWRQTTDRFETSGTFLCPAKNPTKKKTKFATNSPLNFKIFATSPGLPFHSFSRLLRPTSNLIVERLWSIWKWSPSSACHLSTLHLAWEDSKFYCYTALCALRAFLPHKWLECLQLRGGVVNFFGTEFSAKKHAAKHRKKKVYKNPKSF